MRSTVLAAILGLVAVTFAQSPVPGCTQTCPEFDTAGFALGPGTSDTDGSLFCSYPAFPGENPNDFFCTYNDSTGALITDNNAGFCQDTAVASGCVNRRTRALVHDEVPLPQAVKEIRSVVGARRKLMLAGKMSRK
ncbi:hypothetical protein RQP46_008735 [Phenoliferia psychrophenolica]